MQVIIQADHELQQMLPEQDGNGLEWLRKCQY